MKASIQISTGLMIGSWEPADDENIIQDAINKGIHPDDVELRDVTHEEHIRLIAERDAVTMSYRDKRRIAYPDINDQLDALWKIVMALENGQNISKDAKDIQDMIENIKTKFPKI